LLYWREIRASHAHFIPGRVVLCRKTSDNQHLGAAPDHPLADQPSTRDIPVGAALEPNANFRHQPPTVELSVTIEWIWGRRPVVEALHSRRALAVFIAGGIRDLRFIEELHAAAAKSGLTVETLDNGRIDQIAPGQTTQGVLAKVAPFAYSSIDAILDLPVKEGRAPLLLLLDQIQDPRNLGSLIRSAEAAGVDGLVLTQRRTAPISGIVSKASAGAVFHLPVARVASLSAVLARLGKLGVWTIGLDQSAPRTIYDCDLTAPSAIIVGSEGSGLRRLTTERADIMASIPTRGHVASLNASVAGAIALFEANRQRRNPITR
jgi:23S rRNA (guanosine2251-2'-O)-methyltransferase